MGLAKNKIFIGKRQGNGNPIWKIFKLLRIWFQWKNFLEKNNELFYGKKTEKLLKIKLKETELKTCWRWNLILSTLVYIKIIENMIWKEYYDKQLKKNLIEDDAIRIGLISLVTMKIWVFEWNESVLTKKNCEGLILNFCSLTLLVYPKSSKYVV